MAARRLVESRVGPSSQVNEGAPFLKLPISLRNVSFCCTFSNPGVSHWPNCVLVPFLPSKTSVMPASHSVSSCKAFHIAWCLCARVCGLSFPAPSLRLCQAPLLLVFLLPLLFPLFFIPLQSQLFSAWILCLFLGLCFLLCQGLGVVLGRILEPQL